MRRHAQASHWMKMKMMTAAVMSQNLGVGGGASEGLEEAGFAVEVASGAEPGEEAGEELRVEPEEKGGKVESKMI